MMSWADCGTDSQGRPIGYAFDATCDQDGCDTAIDRGLAYACGGMHGEDVYSCEGYFCYGHLTVVETLDGQVLSVCHPCARHAGEETL